MHAILKTFDVGSGDCIFLVLKEDALQYSIMIDCGSCTNEVKSYIENDLNKKIDLLILTHIDNDHLAGVPDILKEIDNLSIEKIIYNCGQGCLGPDVQPKTLEEDIKEDLQKVSLSPEKNPFGQREVNAEKAVTVAETILKNDGFRQAWSHQTDYVSVDTPPLVLLPNFGRLIFISPEKSNLDKLDKKFRIEFNKRFFRKYDGPYDNDASLFETLFRLIPSSKDPIKSEIAGVAPTINSVKKLASEESKHNITDENKASIAFFWERGAHRILFCGDADPKIMVFYFLKKTNPFSGYAIFDAIKVAHHGSEHNSGSKFWDLFDSKNIFITGGNSNSRPSKACLAKIISRPTENIRTLYRTKPNNSCNWIDTPDLKSNLKFSISTDSTYEFDC